MRLKDYLDSVGMTPAEFSRFAKLSPNVIYRVLEGKEILKKSADIIYKRSQRNVKYTNLHTRGQAS